MRSDELEDAARKAAGIGSVAAWSDWPASRILQLCSQRHATQMGDQQIRARAGYGLQFQILACVAGTRDYPVPARAVGGAFEKLELLLPGQQKWLQLERLEVTGAEDFDLGATFTGRPVRFLVQDGFVQLYPTPEQAYGLRFSYYLRPSKLVTSQSSTLGGDGVDRGRITGINTTARTVTVNVVPFDQLLAVPAAITSAVQQIDIVRPNGTFACAMFSVPQTLASTTFTLGGTDSMARVQVGDYVRVADQTDWPMGLPEESHVMVAHRAAMEISRDIGDEEKIALLGQAVDADLRRFQTARAPQVKSTLRTIPLRPMSSR